MAFENRRGAFALVGIVLSAVLGSCGGGGGGGGSDVSFSFALASAPLSENAGPTNVLVVLHTPSPLLADVSVEVADAGTGTATAGTDYAAFAPQTLTFLAGAVEGEMQSVSFTPLDDLLVEGVNETARLRLQNATGGGLSSPSLCTATLTDADSATVGFATGGSATPDESAGAEPVALELDCGAGVTLGTSVSVRVSDVHTGSATSADYSFSARTVTFPVGSADGAVQTVDVTVRSDTSVEGDETVELGLSTPATCTLGPTTSYVLTISDDDAGGLAAFVGTEGASGTGNSLAYDELLALGSQTVGAGPNAGTLVRVANGGGTSMALGTPRVAGSHPNDFAVDLQSTSLAFGGQQDGASALLPADEPTPLAASLDDGPGVALRIDTAELARMAALSSVVLHDFVLPDLGPVTLELERRPLPLASDAKLAIDGVEVAGGLRTLVGGLQLWSGVVQGLDGSRVFLALSAGSAQGFLELPEAAGRFVHLVPESAGLARLVDEFELEALGFTPPDELCAGERFVPGATLQQLTADDPAPSTSALTLSDCRLALETDYQFYQKFNSSTLLTNYVTELVAAVSEQYVTDVQTTLSIAYLGIHTTVDDGWDTQEVSGGNAGDLLDEFKAAWGSNNWPVEADLAHFLSGDGLGGGVAYVNVLCSPGFGFGVSGNLSGTIDWSAWTGASGNFTWDFMVVAHEIGHNFGSQHTHDYCPPLDRCYANCAGPTSCSLGTLMSYCHTCGGQANIALYFHPVCANIMRANVNSSCLDDAALAPGNFVQFRVRFNPLTSTGARSATLEFAHDATNVTAPFRVQLSGTAN